MPKYLLLIHEDESAFAAGGQASFDEVMAAHMSFATELDQLGGKSLGGEALQPLATATFLRGTRTGAVSMVDNPSPDVKETLGGYYLVEANDDEHARKIAERVPAQFGYIEIRPIWDFSQGA
jgi:hypothetical protein